MLNIDQRLNQLKDLPPAATPPFLLTRIQAAIAAGGLPAALVPRPWQRFALAAALVLMCANGLIIYRTKSKTGTAAVEQLAEGLHLSTNNNLYHD